MKDCLRKKMKKTAAAFCAGVMLLSLAGCNKSKAEKKEYRTVKESDPYYSSEEVELQIPLKEGKELQQLLVREPEITEDQVRYTFDLQYKMPKELQDKQYLCAQNIDGFSDEEKIAIWEEWMTYFDEGVACFDLDGNFLGVEKVEEENPASVPWAENISGLVGFQTLSNGRILAWSFDKMVLLEQSGKELASSNPELFGGKAYVVGEELYVKCRHYDDDKPDESYDYIMKLDKDTLKETGSQIRLPGSGSVDDICAGEQGLFFIGSDGIYKINTKNGQLEDFLLWSDTDLNYVWVIGEGAKISEEKSFLIKYRDETVDEHGHMVMHVFLEKLTKEAKNPHAGKTIIELGDARENDDDLVEAVVAFNKLSDKKVRIHMHDYSTYANAYGAYEKTISTIADQVYLDMLAGTGPDILVNFGTCPSFQNENILLDLMPYLNGDSGLSDSEYYGTILRAYEKNGKAFHLPTNVELLGFWGNQEFLPDTASISASGFDTIRASLPENTLLLPAAEYDDLLETWLPQILGQYLDMQNGRADFNNDSFIALLEAVKKYGSHVEEPIEIEYEEAMAKAPETLLHEKMVAMIPYIISSPKAYKDCLALGNGHGRVYAFGDVSGMAVDSRMTVAISKSTPYAQEAWDFLCTLFNEENQKHFAENLGGIPVSRSGVDALCKKCEMTENEASAFEAELERTHEVCVRDDSIMDIVKEEAEGFFMGQKEIRSVVSTINNRVATILKERK